MEELKNKLWVYGHPTNSLKHITIKDSNVDAVDSLNDFGAKNLFFIPMGLPCDKNAKCQEMKDVAKVGWSVGNRQEAQEIIELKKKWPNISVAIFDDFFNATNPGSNFTNYSIKEMLALKESFNSAGIEMWAVFYSDQTDPGAWVDYLKVFDGVTFWFWREPSMEEFDSKCQFLIEHTQGQKRMLGCFLYNIGHRKEALTEMTRYQLDKNLERIKKGELDGIILHTNAFGGVGYKAYDEAARWCKEHGNDLV